MMTMFVITFTLHRLHLTLAFLDKTTENLDSHLNEKRKSMKVWTLVCAIFVVIGTALMIWPIVAEITERKELLLVFSSRFLMLSSLFCSYLLAMHRLKKEIRKFPIDSVSSELSMLNLQQYIIGVAFMCQILESVMIVIFVATRTDASFDDENTCIQQWFYVWMAQFVL